MFVAGMAIIALLGIISRLLDKQLAKLIFKSGNFIGGLCEIVGSAIPFALCAFTAEANKPIFAYLVISIF